MFALIISVLHYTGNVCQTEKEIKLYEYKEKSTILFYFLDGITAYLEKPLNL